MSKIRTKPTCHNKLGSTAKHKAIEVVSKYSAYLAARDIDGMSSLRSEDYSVDFVHLDAFGHSPLSAKRTGKLWSALFNSFPVLDLEVTRTMAAEEFVATEWIFTGSNSGPLEPPIINPPIEPTGKTIRIRGASFYDVRDGLIHRETLYMDLTTFFAELGIAP